MASFNGRGVQRMFLNLGTELVRRGYRVTLLVCRAQGLLQRESLGGMRLVPLSPGVPSTWRLARALTPLLRFCIGSSGTPYVSRIGALLRYVDAERPSVIVSGGTRCNLLNSIARQVSPVGYRAVLTEHNPISGKLRRMSRQWKLRSVKGLYPYADAIAAVSAGVAGELTRYLGRGAPLPVLPNPVVTEAFLQSRCEAPHPWLGDGGSPVLLAVGALEPRKNFMLLLRALARVQQRRPVRLIILGEGPQRAALAASARELGVDGVVAMPGFTPRVPDYLSHAAALVLSSTYEGFGCVIVEALACGCPVVSTDCPYGPREILADGRYGRLVAPGDDLGLAVALEQTLDEQSDGQLLAERARHYSVANAADAYLALMFPAQAAAGSSTRSKISS